MGQNILGFCIICTILLMVMVFVIVRKDSAATTKENLRLVGAFSTALILEGVGFFMVS